MTSVRPINHTPEPVDRKGDIMELVHGYHCNMHETKCLCTRDLLLKGLLVYKIVYENMHY